MKRKIFFNIAAFFAISVIIASAVSCTKLFDKDTVENSRKEATIRLTFDAAGGGWENEKGELQGERYIEGVIGTKFSEIMDAPARYGFTFNGWTSSDPEWDLSCTEFPQHDVKFSAKWLEEVVEIKFDKIRIPLIKGDSSYSQTTIKAVLTPAYNTGFKWEISDTEIATLEGTQEGVGGESAIEITVKLIADAPTKKTSKITLTLDNGLTEECEIISAPNVDDAGDYTVLAATEYESPTGIANDGANYVAFGTFPQSVKEDDVEIYGEDWDPVIGGFVTADHCGITYYLGTDFCWYAKTDAARTFGVDQFSDGTPIEDEGTYYFKAEPIVWRVAETDGSGNKLLISEKILEGNLKYYRTIINIASTSLPAREDKEVFPSLDHPIAYSDNWKFSDLRAYLNGTKNQSEINGIPYSNKDWTGIGFIEIAFSPEHQTKIKESKITTSALNGVKGVKSTDTVTTYTTKDKIFVLTEEEVKKTDWGFSGNVTLDTANPSVADPSLKRTPTDYAAANYASKYWWLRNPLSENGSINIRYVNHNGTLSTGSSFSAFIGIVPAMWVE